MWFDEGIVQDLLWDTLIYIHLQPEVTISKKTMHMNSFQYWKYPIGPLLSLAESGKMTSFSAFLCISGSVSIKSW